MRLSFIQVEAAMISLTYTFFEPTPYDYNVFVVCVGGLSFIQVYRSSPDIINVYICFFDPTPFRVSRLREKKKRSNEQT